MYDHEQVLEFERIKKRDARSPTLSLISSLQRPSAPATTVLSWDGCFPDLTYSAMVRLQRKGWFTRTSFPSLSEQDTHCPIASLKVHVGSFRLNEHRPPLYFSIAQYIIGKEENKPKCGIPSLHPPPFGTGRFPNVSTTCGCIGGLHTRGLSVMTKSVHDMHDMLTPG